MVTRKHQDNLDSAVAGMEGIERAHQHGAALDGDKLLRQFASHAQSLAAGYYNDVFVHGCEWWAISHGL